MIKTVLVLFLALTGCDSVFRLDRVGPGPDADAAHNSDADASSVTVDAAVDASADAYLPSDPNDEIDFSGFAFPYVCYGEAITASLRLWRDPGTTVTVTVTSANTSYVSISPSSYMFDSTNWSTAQTVTAYGNTPTGTPITITVASPPYYDKTDTLYVRPSGGICP